MPYPIIMIADDDHQNAALLAYRLARESYSPRIAVPSPTHVDHLLMFGTPVAIIIDPRLHKANGLDLLRQLRADERFVGIKVLVLANPDRSAGPEAAHDVGADLYMTKPYSPRELITRLKELLTTPATS